MRDLQEQTSVEWFLLVKIAERVDGLTAEFLDTQLTAPWGWWALASLATQGYVTAWGERVFATEKGREFAALLPR